MFLIIFKLCLFHHPFNIWDDILVFSWRVQHKIFLNLFWWFLIAILIHIFFIEFELVQAMDFDDYYVIFIGVARHTISYKFIRFFNIHINFEFFLFEDVEYYIFFFLNLFINSFYQSKFGIVVSVVAFWIRQRTYFTLFWNCLVILEVNKSSRPKWHNFWSPFLLSRLVFGFGLQNFLLQLLLLHQNQLGFQTLLAIHLLQMAALTPYIFGILRRDGYWLLVAIGGLRNLAQNSFYDSIHYFLVVWFLKVVLIRLIFIY